MNKRMLALVLAVCVALGALPSLAFAQAATASGEPANPLTSGATSEDPLIEVQADTSANTNTGVWGTCPWDISDAGVLTIHPGTGEDTKSSKSPWADLAGQITSVVVKEEGGSKVVLPSKCNGLFRPLKQVTSIDLSGADASSVQAMGRMFLECSSLKSIDLAGLDTSNVTSMERMFMGCSSLTSIDLSGLNTSNVTNMDSMFSFCGKLASINLGTIDTSHVTNMAGMFDSCANLKSLDLSGISTASVTNAQYMFRNCTSLKKISVGALYVMRNTDMFPFGKWQSEATGASYALDVLVKNRSAIADTYTFVESNGLGNATVTLSASSYTYNGTARKPSVTLKINGKVVPASNYTVEYKNNVNVGTARIYIVAKPTSYDYSGKVSSKFKINPKSITPALALAKTSYAYTGKAITPSATVKDGSATLKKDVDYTLSYASGRKNVGTYNVKVTLKGNYRGTKTQSFTIVPKATTLSKVTAAKKAFKATWKKQATQNAGYQVQYALKKNFSGAKKLNVKGATKTSGKVTGLKAKKTYYVRVRTYKKVGSKTYYSAWSAAKTVKTK